MMLFEQTTFVRQRTLKRGLNVTFPAPFMMSRIAHYLAASFSQPEILIPNIAIDGDYLDFNKLFQTHRILFAQWIERMARNNRRPKSIFDSLASRPEPSHTPSRSPENMQQHRQRDLPNKAHR